MEFGAFTFLLATLAVTLGAILQAATGLGAGLVIVPLLALISVKLVPAPVIFASIVLSFLMAYKGRRAIRFSNMSLLLVGLLLGMVAGAYAITFIPLSSFGLVFGLLILLAVAISFKGIKVKFSSISLLTAGGLSGLMGTTAAIGAPVLALLYQYEKANTLRATLGFLYLFSSIGMLTVLHFAGYFSRPEMISGVLLMPGFIIGYFVATKLAALLDKGYSRIAVLVISSISAIMLIVKYI